jgi:hypothetical protein
LNPFGRPDLAIWLKIQHPGPALASAGNFALYFADNVEPSTKPDSHTRNSAAQRRQFACKALFLTPASNAAVSVMAA